MSSRKMVAVNVHLVKTLKQICRTAARPVCWSQKASLLLGRSPTGTTPKKKCGLVRGNSWDAAPTAVVSHGSSLFLSAMFQNVTEAKKFIGKSLQPARPVHQLSSKQASPIALNIRTELPSSTEVCLQSKVNWSSEMTEVKILTQTVMLCQPKQHESGAKKERIQYSRDFLLKLSNVSLSQKKPEFLPDHPIVLEKPVKNKPFIDICKK